MAVTNDKSTRRRRALFLLCTTTISLGLAVFASGGLASAGVAGLVLSLVLLSSGSKSDSHWMHDDGSHDFHHRGHDGGDSGGD